MRARKLGIGAIIDIATTTRAACYRKSPLDGDAVIARLDPAACQRGEADTADPLAALDDEWARPKSRASGQLARCTARRATMGNTGQTRILWAYSPEADTVVFTLYDNDAATLRTMSRHAVTTLVEGAPAQAWRGPRHWWAPMGLAIGAAEERVIAESLSQRQRTRPPTARVRVGL